jgi:3-phenylpropionate/trans-cinnamate dioxygenase ferredoxin reductase subunit
MSTDSTFVIVGASLAGAKAAETLRAEGFDGRLVLIGDEPDRPYERPPLSKEYLRGESPRDKLFVHDERFYEENEIDLRTSTRATAIDVRGSEVALSDGERLRFDRLLLATGAEPRRLPIPGGDLNGVLYLREVRDSDAIRERLDRGGRMVVIGGGWIGSEVAASARERGLDVTIVEQSEVPLERVLGRAVGEIYAGVHADHGVRLLPRSMLEAFEGSDGSVERVRLADGRTLEAEAVVVGVGVGPRSELASEAGIPVENGVLVDERLRSGAPTVFAAGDVANARHPLFGRNLRIEHWANALNQGPAAARNMLDRDEPYDRVPYFFSDQYDVGMEYSGHATMWDEVVLRGDVSAREFIAFWVKDGRVMAGMNVNVWGVTDQIQQLVRSGDEVDSARLRDPDIPLEEVAAGGAGAHGRGEGAPGAARRILRQGVRYPARLVSGRMSKADPTPADDLAPGDARVLQIGDDKVAAYRDDDGRLHSVSAICTHMGCVVDWNRDERTWDCPCHGSRFDHDGHVLNGPAKRDLEVKVVEPDQPEPAAR